jgi:hypothetical protein
LDQEDRPAALAGSADRVARADRATAAAAATGKLTKNARTQTDGPARAANPRGNRETKERRTVKKAT